MMRQKRKLDHLNLVQYLDDGPAKNGFEDIQFVHNCLPEVNAEDIDLSAKFLGRQFNMPFMVNSITGGIDEAEGINSTLAKISSRLSVPMAVGSQTAALEKEELCYTFDIARRQNPDGFIAANLGAGASLPRAQKAVDMIGADALQLHLNVPQELMMPGKEQEPSCRGYLENIEHLVAQLPVPLIAKEVGFGIAREQAQKLLSTGIDALDVGGSGGTNFIKVEGFRYSCEDVEPFLSWGLPTAVTLYEVQDAVSFQGEIVATGGIRNGVEAAKALSMGADLVGVAAPLLHCYYQGGEAAVEKYLLGMRRQLRQTMFMLGAQNIHELRRKPLVIRGETAEWLRQRGIDTKQTAFREEF